MRTKALITGVLTASLLLPSASLGQSFDVKARKGEWRPDSRVIDVGDKIVWSNPTSKKHNVVAYRGPWDKNTMLEPGETTRKRFKEPAVYKYRCSLHSTKAPGSPCRGMCGKIVVEKN
ncbi:MAG: plastocyanin/azurin family copper-binding protein [Actinomycetota bacterium]|nr:plastocyanin/azurin family copper-binding protein [Actinomycetota bacterium]